MNANRKKAKRTTVWNEEEKHMQHRKDQWEKFFERVTSKSCPLGNTIVNNSIQWGKFTEQKSPEVTDSGNSTDYASDYTPSIQNIVREDVHDPRGDEVVTDHSYECSRGGLENDKFSNTFAGKNSENSKITILSQKRKECGYKKRPKTNFANCSNSIRYNNLRKLKSLKKSRQFIRQKSTKAYSNSDSSESESGILTEVEHSRKVTRCKTKNKAQNDTMASTFHSGNKSKLGSSEEKTNVSPNPSQDDCVSSDEERKPQRNKKMQVDEFRVNQDANDHAKDVFVKGNEVNNRNIVTCSVKDNVGQIDERPFILPNSSKVQCKSQSTHPRKYRQFIGQKSTKAYSNSDSSESESDILTEVAHLRKVTRCKTKNKAQNDTMASTFHSENKSKLASSEEETNVSLNPSQDDCVSSDEERKPQRNKKIQVDEFHVNQEAGVHPNDVFEKGMRKEGNEGSEQNIVTSPVKTNVGKVDERPNVLFHRSCMIINKKLQSNQKKDIFKDDRNSRASNLSYRSKSSSNEKIGEDSDKENDVFPGTSNAHSKDFGEEYQEVFEKENKNNIPSNKFVKEPSQRVSLDLSSSKPDLGITERAKKAKNMGIVESEISEKESNIEYEKLKEEHNVKKLKFDYSHIPKWKRKEISQWNREFSYFVKYQLDSFLKNPGSTLYPIRYDRSQQAEKSKKISWQYILEGK